MNYAEFEDHICTYINDNWDEEDAVLIGEYYAKDGSSGNTLEYNIGVESDEATLGTFDGNTKNLNIQSGTVNLQLSLTSNVGRTEAIRLIALVRALFHNYIYGAIKFRGVIKRNNGTLDGKLLKLIVCPFTVEIIE